LTLDSLTVVVLNWRNSPLTIRSVQSLLCDDIPPARVVLVDNESEQTEYERLRAALPAVAIVRLPQNVGFARANNEGARVLPGETYLFVNNDAFVERSGSVAALVDVLDDPRAGLVVPRLLNEDLSLQPSVSPLYSPAVALGQASGFARLISNERQPDWSTRWDHSTKREIQAATGAVLLVRGRTWRELGGFSERTFMYAEDRDLCWRARRQGWSVHFTPAAEFVHLGSASADQRWPRRFRAEAVARAEAHLIHDRFSRPVALATRGLLSAGFVGRWLLWTISRRPEAAAETLGSLSGFVRPLHRVKPAEALIPPPEGYE